MGRIMVAYGKPSENMYHVDMYDTMFGWIRQTVQPVPFEVAFLIASDITHTSSHDARLVTVDAM